MKRISIYGKYNIGRLVSVFCFILFLMTDNFIFALLFFLSFLFYAYFKCPKCGNRLGRLEDDFVATPFQGKRCNRCGEDLSKCY